MDKLLALLGAIFAYTILSVGLVFMKKGVSWIGWKKENRGNEFYFNLFIWLSGFILINVSIVPNAFALKTLPPHIVSSIAGWGIIIMIVLSYWWLKELLVKSDFFYFFLIITGIFLLGFFEKNSANKVIPGKSSLFIATVFPFLILSFLFICKKAGDKFKAIILSSISGISAGLIIIYMKILVNIFGFKIINYFSSVYLYIYLLFSILSFIFLQLAYKKGEMIIVGPIYYSLNIVYTVIVSVLIFKQTVEIIQIFAIGFIILSLFKLYSIDRTKIVKKRTL